MGVFLNACAYIGLPPVVKIILLLSCEVLVSLILISFHVFTSNDHTPRCRFREFPDLQGEKSKLMGKPKLNGFY